MTTRSRRKPTRPTLGAHHANVIDFHDNDGTHSGTDSHFRWWQITKVYTGWRLEFRDPGDMRATYAGTHTTLAAAQAEAGR